MKLATKIRHLPRAVRVPHERRKARDAAHIAWTAGLLAPPDDDAPLPFRCPTHDRIDCGHSPEYKGSAYRPAVGPYRFSREEDPGDTYVGPTYREYDD